MGTLEIDPHAPGWDAIDAALERVHRGVEPRHYGAVLPMMVGGTDPLHGVSAFPAESPSPHFHVVTYGFSELFEKESDDPATSGHGFELTMRLARAAGENELPPWAFSFFQNLARYVFRSGNSFAVGDHMTLNGPIALGSDTAIRAILFCSDPTLAPIDTPNGKVAFLEVVGITEDELQAAQSWDAGRFIELLAKRDPLLVTHLGRRSILEDPAAAREIAEGISRDGSSYGATFVTQLAYQTTERELRLELGALAMRSMPSWIDGRLARGRRLTVLGPGKVVHLVPGERTEWRAVDDGLEVTLSPATVDEMRATLGPKRGRTTFASAPGLVIEVIPTVMKGPTGDEIGTIG